MSKVPVDKDKALAVAPLSAAELIPTTAEDMDAGIIEPSTSLAFLPQLEMVFPIMITPDKPAYKGHDYKFGFMNGGEFEPIPAGTILTVIDKRNAARKGGHGDPDKEYAYSFIERKKQQIGSTGQRFDELNTEAKMDKSIKIGYSFVVAAIFPDGRCAILDFTPFSTIAPYMYAPLAPAKMIAKAGLKINLEDHTPNLTKAKSTGYFYPDAKKFKQWEHVTLTGENLTAVQGAFEKADAAIINWMNK